MKRIAPYQLVRLSVVILVVIIGYLAIRGSFASTAVIALEPETATITGNAEVLNNSQASSGKAITFSNAMYGPQPASKPSGAIMPEGYGAVGDGVTDDSAALQSALDAARAAGGGTVWLSSKTYLMNQSLSVSSNTSLKGAGPKAVLKFTWLYTAGGGSPSLPGQGHYIKNRQSAGDSNITFSNFVIEGATNGEPSGIDSQVPYQLAASLRLGNTINNFSITHMEIRNSPSASISYHGGQNGVISYNYVHNSGRDGITGFWGPGTAGTNTNITVSYNYVNKTGDDMIGINGLPTGQFNNISIPSNITIVHNTVEDWYTDPNGRAVARGIFLVGVRGGLVANNSIINTSANSPGILISGTFGIFGNLGSYDPLTGPGTPWISDNITVKDNTIYNAGQLPGIGSAGNGFGILIDTLRNSTVSGNRIINSKYGAINNSGCDSCSIQPSN